MFASLVASDESSSYAKFAFLALVILSQTVRLLF